MFLQNLLHLNHLSSKSRAPEILLLASLLLGILQYYGAQWAGFSITRKNFASKNLKTLWVNHILRTIFPFVVVVSTLLHYVISQSVSFNEGKTAPLESHDSFISQITYLVLFLSLWLLLVFLFHFLSEKNQVNKIQKHFENINNLNFKFKTSHDGSWGLWFALIEHLNSLTQTLLEKTKIVKSFSQFVTANFVQQLIADEAHVNKGITKEMTVIMSDLRNFTNLSEKLRPEQVVELLNDYFAVMLEIMSSFNIVVDKYIGDGILAYVDSENEMELKNNIHSDNFKAVTGALAMLNGLEKLNPQLKAKNLPEIQIGIGIYRGPLVIGLIGSEAKLQHTIIGDTVNRAARLESLCKELGSPIVISENIYESLPTNLKSNFKLFQNTKVKGLNEQLQVYGYKNVQANT